ncbi:hypothetical protein D3C76_1032510 [compost metagenome]
MRQYPFGDTAVILGQVHFTGTAAGIDDALGMGNAHLAGVIFHGLASRLDLVGYWTLLGNA